uniref:Uncharacterized protein n=1 Tax=Trieres chinensis TaxID=1514140 RepID=A0A7S1ZBY6_TRICV|mmetsp:Transcript_22226/g.44979  ORF Transcript_22226/g.44979 Transcript_22226/m.44979 type:complete len:176 (+) Transcript_22226:117-644(+)|eukprot:CAMPEP_0183296944 /NCGR_PEP_ID=MMETSP0160_2-20130417/4350_1 /TAXON_ID=2839 ORGANISM="Odontella Sinensis, Strain Grunow 1884" /NCGR_SAMPLE_ID=MMETSP0160_2 /ASSEMBLY_ACC=CAM_ASM_000250 /LENGTH=175 /DNA_ID=CAMNT_0025458651 /DNA_START=45 /DNA_END=572 /DNA_ORIENTATION=-
MTQEESAKATEPEAQPASEREEEKREEENDDKRDGDADDEDYQRALEEEEAEEAVYEETDWDEGGSSQCGYSDSVHSTLMAAGNVVHKVVGAPSQQVRGSMLHIGNWFQEASYAVRDLVRGNHKEMEQDFVETVSSLKANVKRVGSDLSGKEGTTGGGSGSHPDNSLLEESKPED